MRRPNESLDDYVVKAQPESVEPPRRVTLRLTGEVEVLKPLARWEHPGKLAPTSAEIILRPAPQGLSWFHRSLIAGGALSLSAIVLASAIVIGVSDSTVGPDTSQVEFIQVPNDIDRLEAADEPLSSDIFSSTTTHRTSKTADAVKRRPRNGRLRLVRAAEPLRKTSPRKVSDPQDEPHQSLVSKFVPTTLVIYIENGVVKSRLEPWAANGK
jgi:hypothetical protein